MFGYGVLSMGWEYERRKPSRSLAGRFTMLHRPARQFVKVGYEEVVEEAHEEGQD